MEISDVTFSWYILVGQPLAYAALKCT